MSRSLSWAIRLGLLNELSLDLNKKLDPKTTGSKNDVKDVGNDPKKAKKSYLPNLPDKPNKTWIVRGIAVSVVAIVCYFVFGYNPYTPIEVEKIECQSNSLKITAKGNKTYEMYELGKNGNDKNAYAVKLPHVSQEDIYEIYLTSKSGKFSFRASKSKFENGKDANDHGGKWVYKVSSNQQYTRAAYCKDPSKGCCCGSNGKGCDCSNGSDTGCTCTGGNGNGCACCVFMNWIDTAILQMSVPGQVTPASVFFSLLPTLLYVGFFLFLARSAMKAQGIGGLGGPGGIFKIGQSLSKTVKSNVLFKNVAGLNEEKVELLEIVDYLKAPNKYKAMGARVPRGVILYGPPGTGKTLLAKAVSGEADVPFIEVSGATFDDMYVGSGAKRVRDLFAKAKKLAPCIVFIDEIDAVAGKRGNKFIGGGGGVYDQTINQMLSEMDGFNTSDGIVVMAATNRLDSIDDAILRPGRFDRHIQVGLPNIKDRVEILKVHAKNKNISSSVDMEDIARKTPGFSGAQLENVLNEATLLAVRNSKRSVVTSDIEEAIDRVMAGPSKKSHRMSDGERRQVAYHEAGHAIAGLYSKEGEVVEKITIIPRGQAAGYMLSAPEKQETFIKRKDELLSIVVTTLGGRASEEIFYGLPRVSTGAANDLFKVTRLVTDMITKFGMSDKLGLYQYVPSEGTINPYKNQYSEDVSRTIDEEVSRIISEQYLKAKQMIIEHAQELKLIVECLLLLETIDRNQINHIHSTMTLPPEAIKMKDKLRSEGKTIDLSPDSDALIY